jgi:hypothetical protein
MGVDRRAGEHEQDEVVRQPKQADGQAATGLSHLFRAAAAGRADVLGRSGMRAIQRAVGNSAVSAMLQRESAEEEPSRSPVHDVVSSGGGEALSPDTQAEMEARLGADFSDVRVHTGAAAHDSARDVGARAYTVGNNVVFQRDAYDPSSHEGRTTLAHELTHVIQQRNGPVEGTEAPGGIRVSDPSDRFEREAVARAEQVMAEPVPASGPGPAPVASPAAVQRQSEDEDEQPADVQGSFVQRAAEGGEEEEAAED